MNLIENSDLNLLLDDISELHFLCVNCGKCRRSHSFSFELWLNKQSLFEEVIKQS